MKGQQERTRNRPLPLFLSVLARPCLFFFALYTQPGCLKAPMRVLKSKLPLLE